MALSDKQKAEREQALGSSDAPIVAGVSSYCSPLELYYKLHGELPRYSDDETEAMEWGNRLEAVVAAAWAEKTGHKIRRVGTLHHRRHAFLCANLDYEIIGTAKGPGVLEIKTRDRGDLDRWDREGVPDDISIQVAHQLAVSNREWAQIAVLFGGKVFRSYEVGRDRELEEYIIEIEARFMLRVQRSEPPTEAWTPDNLGILKKLYPTSSEKTIALPNHVATCDAFLRAKAEVEQAETNKALYEGMLKEAMGEAAQATIPGYSISWRSTKASQRFDEERFKAEHPDLYQQFMKTVPGYRRFLVKPTKEIAT